MAFKESVVETTLLGDEKLTLRLDFNSMALLEELSGKSFMSGNFQPESATDLRLFIWCCLYEYHERPLTLEDVGAMLHISDLGKVAEEISRLMVGADTDPTLLAPYVPTAVPVLVKALEMVAIQPGENFMDIGCGDGRTLILAAKAGAGKCLGFENNEQRAKMARDAAKAAGVDDKVAVVLGNARELAGKEIPNMKVVFLYLLTRSNTELKPMLEELPKGARLISHDFPMVGWEPKEVVDIDADGRTHKLWLYER